MFRRAWPSLSLFVVLFVVFFASFVSFVDADDQDKSQENQVAGKVQDWLDKELSRFRKELLGELRKDLNGTAQKAPSTTGGTIDAALAAIQAEETFSYDEWLSSDDRHGRETGQPGCNDAAEYIRAHFEEDGLTPIGDDGTFYQHYTIGKKKPINAQNVIGMIEGNDRKDEYVVIGAHYDHVGEGPVTMFNGRMGGPKGDDLYNGADDNASGTSGLLEIAKAFGKRMHPSRSIIFIAFSGEEKGLLGSKYYAAHPLRPLEKTVAMINMDMIGRNPDKAVQVLGTQTSAQLAVFAKEAAEKVGAKVTYPTSGVFGGSDHYSFYEKGVPVLFYFSGFHKDYHRSSDSSEKISHEQLEHCARMAAIALWDVANTDEKIEFKKLPGGSGVGKPRLGVTPGELDEDKAKELGIESGVVIQSVLKGSAAEQGGVEKDDIVVKFNGQVVSDAESFRDQIREARAGEDIPMTVVRDGKSVDLTIRLK